MNKAIYLGGTLAYYALLVLIRFLDAEFQHSILQGFPSLSLAWARPLQILLFFYPVLAILSLLFLEQVFSNYARLIHAASDQRLRRVRLLLALSFAWIGLILLFAGVPMTRALGAQGQAEAKPSTFLQAEQARLSPPE